MSYNNNHAGMHLMWYRKYGNYDDLAHYDKLAERNAKQNKKEEILNSPSKEKVDDILEKIRLQKRTFRRNLSLLSTSPLSQENKKEPYS